VAGQSTDGLISRKTQKSSVSTDHENHQRFQTLLKSNFLHARLSVELESESEPAGRPGDSSLPLFHMNWYYKTLGGHTHVRVFMNGARCGDLVFRNEEFVVIRQALDNTKVMCLPDRRLVNPSPLVTFFAEES
jgi:hypothetical protein